MIAVRQSSEECPLREHKVGSRVGPCGGKVMQTIQYDLKKRIPNFKLLKLMKIYIGTKMKVAQELIIKVYEPQ